MKRIVVNNIILLFLYFILFFALDFYYVKSAQKNTFMFKLGEIVICSFPIASFFVTWFSRYRRDVSRRFLASLGTALLVTTIGFLVIVLAGIPFHMWISTAQ